MSRVPSVGIQLPEVERLVPWAEYAAMARAAEAGGFDSVWVGDHLLYRDDGRPERGPWEAWTLLAGLAAVTDRVALGPLVACAGFHPPAVLAKMAATVDEISGGRLVLGLGAGWNEPDFTAFGLPFDRRVSRFAEAWGIVRALLDGERLTLDGRFWTLHDAVLRPAPARRPPLMIGSSGPRVLSLALPHADAWNVWYDLYGNTAEGFAARSAEVDRAAEAVGRDPREIRRSACALVVLDREAAERPVPPGVTPIDGEPEHVAAALRELADAGADEVILVASPITERSVHRLAEAVALLR